MLNSSSFMSGMGKAILAWVAIIAIASGAIGYGISRFF
jgi:hypothetical protein